MIIQIIAATEPSSPSSLTRSDEMTNTKGNGNREAFGQGLGQFLSGALGGKLTFVLVVVTSYVHFYNIANLTSIIYFELDHVFRNGRMYHNWTEYDESSFWRLYKTFINRCCNLYALYHPCSISSYQLDPCRWVGRSNVCCYLLHY